MNYKPTSFVQPSFYGGEQRKHNNGFLKFIFGVISVVLTIVLCLITATSLRSYARTGANSDSKSYSLAEKLETEMVDVQREALNGIFEMKKIYVIPEDEVVAPMPNSGCYGTASNPEELRPIYALAQEYGLISGNDNMLFNDDRWDGKEIKYYLDQSIMAVMWKSEQDGEAYVFSEIAIAHPSQFKRYLTGDRFGSSAREVTSVLSSGVNAVVGMSGDFYGFRNEGIMIYRRKLCRFNPGRLDFCLIDESGNMHLLNHKEAGSEEDMKKYIEDNNILFSLSFGPILIKDGVVNDSYGPYRLGQVEDDYSRAAIGQVSNLHYLLCTVDSWSGGTTPNRVGYTLKRLGCDNAYTLDGGQTGTIYFNKKVFNRVGYGNERPISDIIYFATAIPE